MDFDTTHGSPEEEERKQIIQDIIDRMLYNPGFKDHMKNLVQQVPLNESMKNKIKRSPKEFKYN